MSSTTRRGPYRSRSGWIFGVCAGLAEYFDMSVFWTRVLTFVTFVLTGFWPVGAIYLVLALLLKKTPWTSCIDGPASKCGAPRQGNLDERIRNLEDVVTRRGDDWDTRLNNG